MRSEGHKLLVPAESPHFVYATALVLSFDDARLVCIINLWKGRKLLPVQSSQSMDNVVDVKSQRVTHTFGFTHAAGS